MSKGKTRREALRLLRRHISDAAFSALRADAHLLDHAASQPGEPDAERVLQAAA